MRAGEFSARAAARGGARIAALAAALVAGGATAALGQAAGFHPSDYGKAQLPTRQSTGDAATYIEANKGGAFEPVAELDRDDPLAALARPVGRIDVVLRHRRTGEEVGTSCTGGLLAGDLVLTNHHCLPVEGDLAPVRASILMDYLTLDGRGAQRFEIEPRPVEWSASLDYAIARVKGQPTAVFGTIRVAAATASAGRSLLVVHHPLGRPKVMSRFRCLAVREQDETGPDLRHRCDTLGGSSGSLLFDGRSMGIALHKEGGLDPRDPSSFNSATRMAALLKASRVLSDLAARGPAEAPVAVAAPQPAESALSGGPPARRPVTPATTGAMSADQMNDVLRSR